MADKVVTLSEAAAMVPDGALVASTPPFHGAPVEFFKELIRQGRRELHMIHATTGGWAADLLVGAGVTKYAEGGALAMGDEGASPNFRRMVQAGEIKPLDST